MIGFFFIVVPTTDWEESIPPALETFHLWPILPKASLKYEEGSSFDLKLPLPSQQSSESKKKISQLSRFYLQKAKRNKFPSLTNIRFLVELDK